MDNRKKISYTGTSTLPGLKDAVEQKNVDDKPDGVCICAPSCPFNENLVSRGDIIGHISAAAPTADVQSCTCKEEHTDDKPDGTCACSPSCRFLDAEQNINEQLEEDKCTCSPICPFKIELESKEDKDVQETEVRLVGVDERCTCKEEHEDDKPDGSCACSPSCRLLDSQKASQVADKQNETEEVIEVICQCPSLATSDYRKWDCKNPLNRK